MHEQRAGGTQLQFELSNRLEKRLAFDIARGATDFNDRHIGAFSTVNDPALDLIGDVGNDLYRTTQIITPALFAEHGVVDTSRGEIIALAHGCSGEALVVT